MDAIFDVAVAMDDLYLQHLLSDLECLELIIWPIRIAADSILKTKQQFSIIFHWKSMLETILN